MSKRSRLKLYGVLFAGLTALSLAACAGPSGTTVADGTPVRVPSTSEPASCEGVRLTSSDLTGLASLLNESDEAESLVGATVAIAGAEPFWLVAGSFTADGAVQVGLWAVEGRPTQDSIAYLSVDDIAASNSDAESASGELAEAAQSSVGPVLDCLSG